MKRLLAFALLSLNLPFAAWAAQEFVVEESITIRTDQTLTDNWYGVAENLLFSGIAQKDLFAIASHYYQSAEAAVGRDCFVLAPTAMVAGRIGDDLRVAAGELNLEAKVKGSTLILGRSVKLAPEAELQDSTIWAGDLLIEGTLKGETRLKAEKVVIRGVVAGPLTIDAQQIILGPGAKLQAGVRYRSPQAMVTDPGAVVQGQVDWQRSEPPSDSLVPLKRAHWSTLLLFLYRLTVLTGLLVLGSLLVLLLPAPVRRYALAVRFKPWASFGWGLLIAVLTPILTFFLVLTVFGIPLALAVVAVFMGLAFFARIGVGYFLGLLILRPLPEAKGKNLLAFILGLVILTLLGWVPVLGPVINLVVVLLGLGALWAARGVVEPSVPKAPAPVPALPKAIEPAAKPPILSKAASHAPAAENWKPSVPAFKLRSPGRKRTGSKKNTAQRVKGKRITRTPARKRGKR